MKIICQACGSKYAIADDKVRGRRVKVRCKSCNEAIIVDGYQPGADDESTQQPEASASGTGDIWSVNLSDTDQRSMTTDEIVSAWNTGQIAADAYVWKDGMGDWVPLASAPDLAPYLSAPTHSAPEQPAYAPAYSPPAPAVQPDFGSPFGVPRAEPARVAGGRSHGGADLFGSVDSAGSEEEMAAMPGAGSYDDHRMTGQRNENSVLFSLDALKVGVGPTAAKAPVARPTPSAEKADLDDIMNMGGGSATGPLFGMNMNQALLSAPPPPPDPPPRPSLPSDAALGGSIAPPGMAQPKSNKLVFVLGGAVAVLVVVAVGLGIVLTRSGKGEEVAKAETAEKSGKTSDKKSEGETPSGDDKKVESERPGEAKTEPAGTTAGPAASGDKKEVSEEDKKRFAEAMKKKEEEGKKEGEKKPEEVVKKEEPSTGVASFNKGAAIAALGGAAAQASGCKRPGGPTGSGKAVVTFAPSGRVTTANVSGGEFPGTPVGSCVAGVFRRAQVPPFSGDPVTVSKGFTISP